MRPEDAFTAHRAHVRSLKLVVAAAIGWGVGHRIRAASDGRARGQARAATRECELCGDRFSIDPEYPDTECCSQECHDTLGTVRSEQGI